MFTSKHIKTLFNSMKTKVSMIDKSLNMDINGCKQKRNFFGLSYV